MHELEYSVGGLILIGLFFIWLGVAAWLARRLSGRLRVRPSLRPLTSFALGAVIFFLPVADELASRPYFEWLCHRGAVLNIDPAKVKGKTMTLSLEPSGSPVEGMLIPVSRTHYVYRDSLTGEVLIQFDTYHARGGVFARFIGITGGQPLTGKFSCAPEGRVAMKKQYGFVVLN